jgi:TolB-like protein/DNA-binding winged helix-turn-helix (wHTH) protein
VKLGEFLVKPELLEIVRLPWDRRNQWYTLAPGSACRLPPDLVQFDEFELDCNRYQLLRAGRRLKLERLPMELLILLLEKEGHLVTREEIVDRLWGKDVFLDTEHGINTAIRKIRNVLRDDPEAPRFVRTVSGRGYQFVASINLIAQERRNGNHDGTQVVPPDPNQTQIDVQVPSSLPRSHHPGVLRKAVLVFAGAVGVVAVLVGVDVRGIRQHLFAHAGRPRIHSLAVLPLENLSGDPAQEYFADGMTDELITMLAKNDGLRVISRTSVMQYKKAQRPMRDIARELRVEGILEGSVSRSAGRVHVNTQLIYAPDDTHLWAESYDRDLRDVGSLQSELAQSIARQVGLVTSPEPVIQRRISPEAHDAYLIGRSYWFRGNDDKSQKYFQKAIDLQPDYAAAWSGLADTWAQRGFEGKNSRDKAIGVGLEAARKGLTLDDTLAEAHITMAAYDFFYLWDWNNAERESARAIELNPGLAEGHHLRSYILQALHRTDQALEEQKKAMELDPFLRPWAMTRALIHARRFDAALAEARLRSELQPNDPTLHGYLSDAYWYNGMEKEAAKEVEISFQLEGNQESAIAVQHAYARGGMNAVLEWELNDRREKYREGHGSPLALAADAGVLKRRDETLHYLEQAYQEKDPQLVNIQYLPYLDFVHNEPRYQAIVKKMGLPPAR